MRTYRFTAEADLDLTRIWEYIAAENLSAANKVTHAVLDACEMLTRFPEAGKRRSTNQSADLRVWTVQPYRSFLVIYRHRQEVIQVLRVLHGSRIEDWKNL